MLLNKIKAKYVLSSGGPVDLEQVHEGNGFRQGYPGEPELNGPSHAGDEPFNGSNTGPAPTGLVEEPSMPDAAFPFSGTNSRREEQPKEEKIARTFLDIIASFAVVAQIKPAAPLNPNVKPDGKIVQKQTNAWQQFLNTLRTLFPGIGLKFEVPPTYVWNPKDKDEQLDIQSVKDKLKTKLPKLVWFKADQGGIDTCDFDLDERVQVELAIGLDANFLTVTKYDRKPDDQEA